MELTVGILIPFLGTTLGAACVFLLKDELHRIVQKGLLGFASGVMVAASVWSLLIPAINMAETAMGRLSFVPAAVGFVLGIFFLLMMDRLIPHLHLHDEKPEGLPAQLKKDNNACACGYVTQYTGGHGSRSGLRRAFDRKQWNHSRRCIGTFCRYCDSELPGGRHYITSA